MTSFAAGLAAFVAGMLVSFALIGTAVLLSAASLAASSWLDKRARAKRLAAVPDLSDPATIDALREQCLETWGPTLEEFRARQLEQDALARRAVACKHWRWTPEAIVAALEAADIDASDDGEVSP